MDLVEDPEIVMHVSTGKTRIDTGETPRERELRGRLEKAEREIEELKKRTPPQPVPLEGKP